MNGSVLNLRSILFIILAVGCLLPSINAPLALFMGIVYANLFANPFSEASSKWVKILLQISIIGLGFGMNLNEALQAGKDGFLFTILTIFSVSTLGYFLQKILKLDSIISFLISTGTAICGGSAIAAVAPLSGAKEKQISIAIGTVFLLNALALFIFPPVGKYLGLSNAQFGMWSAIAIHDTSSVVGAASTFGKEALELATTVKLSRALWIIPLAITSSFYFKSQQKRIRFPFFILFFVLAMILAYFTPSLEKMYAEVSFLAKRLLVLTLFLVGTALNLETIRESGTKAIGYGFILWAFISMISLLGVLYFF